MNEPTHEWIRQASQGDENAMAKLLARYLPELRLYVNRRLGPVVSAKESAGDIVQSSCREVLQHLDRFQYDGEEGFRRWLYATALRKIRDHHRHFLAGKRDVALEANLNWEPGSLLACLDSPSQGAMREEAKERVRAVLHSLSAEHQRIITLAYLEQKSHAEIAKILEISVNNARVRLSRALTQLAKHLRKQGF